MSPDGHMPRPHPRHEEARRSNGASGGRTPSALVAVAREASSLLSGAGLQRADMRWLQGERVVVMLSPLDSPPIGKEALILLTLVPRQPLEASLALLTVDLTDGEGHETSYPVGPDGQALLRVATASYRLRVQAPSDVVPAALVPIPGLGERGATDPWAPRARPAARVRTSRPPNRKAGPASPRRRKRLAILAGVPALVLAVVVSALLYPTARPAVALVGITGRCDDLPSDRGPDHVVVAAVWSGKERQRFTKVLQQFTKNTGVRVTFATAAPTPDRNIGDTLTQLTAKGCPPDLALLPQPGLLRLLARKGLLEAVDDSTAGLVERNYAPAWKQLGSSDGNLYGVWFKAATKSNFWYSSQAFAQAGVPPPTSWQELKEAATRLASVGITPFAIGGHDAWTLTDWFENVYLRTAGPEQYQKLARHEIPWTDPSVTVALRTLAEIFEHPDWIAGGPSGATETTYEDAVKLVFGERREAAMIFAGDFVANEIDGTDGSGGQDARVFPFPSIRLGSDAALGAQAKLVGGAAGGDVAVLMRRTNDGGRKLIRYLASPEAAAPWVKDGGFSSPNRGVDLRLYPDERTRSSAMYLVSADVSFDLSDLQPPSFGSTPGQGMGELLRTFLSNPAGSDSIAKQLEVSRNAAEP